jgi:hypothetical protein
MDERKISCVSSYKCEKERSTGEEMKKTTAAQWLEAN